MIHILLSFFFLLIACLVSQSPAVLVFGLLILLVGLLWCRTTLPKNRLNSMKVFSIVFSFDMILLLFHYLDVKVNGIYIFQDEINSFLPWVQTCLKENSLWNVLKLSYSQSIFMENRGYMLYVGAVGYIAENWFGGYNEMVMFMSSLAFGSLTSVALFKLLEPFSDQCQVFKYALLFSLCSQFPSFSIVLLRDIIIAFFFLCGFLILNKPFSFIRLLGLFLIGGILSQLRMETGLFYVCFIGLYVYMQFKQYKIVGMLFVCLIAVCFIGSYSEYFSEAMNMSMHYREYTMDAARDVQGSFGAKLYELPAPLKQISVFAYSQLQPFPSWVGIANSKTVYSFINAVPPIIYSIFWFVVFFSLFKLVLIKKQYKFCSTNQILIVVICLLYMILNISNMNVRRIMCVYPYLFCVLAYLITNYNCKSAWMRTVKQGIGVYCGFVVLYLLLLSVV